MVVVGEQLAFGTAYGAAILIPVGFLVGMGLAYDKLPGSEKVKWTYRLNRGPVEDRFAVAACIMAVVFLVVGIVHAM